MSRCPAAFVAALLLACDPSASGADAGHDGGLDAGRDAGPPAFRAQRSLVIALDGVRPDTGKRLPPGVFYAACPIGPDGTGCTAPIPMPMALNGLHAQGVALSPGPGGTFDVTESTRVVPLAR